MGGEAKLTRWHRWFAWRPVRLTHGLGVIVWLMPVERCGGYDHRKNDGHRSPPWRWEYRPLASQNKDADHG